MSQYSLSFSIIIPTYNRPQQLFNCLESLVNLNYPQNAYEVIAIDDGGTVDLQLLLKPLFSQFNLKLFKQNNQGPASARNTGCDRASGKFLAFLDDDCTVDPNWLSVLEREFLKTPNALLGGKTINALNQNIYSTSSQLLVDYIYDYYHHKNPHSCQTKFFTSNNLAIKADLLLELGKFDTTFPLAAGEDRDFCDRWFQQQKPMVYVQDSIVYHSHELNLIKFCKQHFNYGRGAICFNESRNKRGLDIIQPEPKEFYVKLLQYPKARGFGNRASFISLLFSISQIAHSVGCFWERIICFSKIKNIR